MKLRVLPSFLFSENMVHYNVCNYGFIFHTLLLWDGLWSSFWAAQGQMLGDLDNEYL